MIGVFIKREDLDTDPFGEMPRVDEGRWQLNAPTAKDTNEGQQITII